MKITYDKEVDAAYIRLAPIDAGAVAKTYPCDPVEVNGMINLDFARNGRLLGIEIIGASQKLPESVLSMAEPIE